MGKCGADGGTRTRNRPIMCGAVAGGLLRHHAACAGRSECRVERFVAVRRCCTRHQRPELTRTRHRHDGWVMRWSSGVQPVPSRRAVPAHAHGDRPVLSRVSPVRAFRGSLVSTVVSKSAFPPQAAGSARQIDHREARTRACGPGWADLRVSRRSRRRGPCVSPSRLSWSAAVGRNRRRLGGLAVRMASARLAANHVWADCAFLSGGRACTDEFRRYCREQQSGRAREQARGNRRQ
jgi:hypothetical protein